MGAQSFIMMYQAGEGWQYGKRKISAMSNEEFNKLTPEIVLEKQAIVLRNALPTIQRSMNDMTPMIQTIIAQYGDFIREMIKALPEAIGNIFEGGITGVGLSGKGSVSGSIGALSPLIPKGGNVAPVEGSPGQRVPSATIKFFSVSELRNMTNVQLVDLRNRINAGAITVHSGTRSDIDNEINIRSGKAPLPITVPSKPVEVTFQAYKKHSVFLFNEVQSIATALFKIKQNAQTGGNPSYWNRRYDDNKPHWLKAKKVFYDYHTLSRNNSNHLIKNDATRMMRHRFPAV